MSEQIEDKLCNECLHYDVCGLRIRIAGIVAFLQGHATGTNIHHWYMSFANICRHYEVRKKEVEE